MAASSSSLLRAFWLVLPIVSVFDRALDTNDRYVVATLTRHASHVAAKVIAPNVACRCKPHNSANLLVEHGSEYMQLTAFDNILHDIIDDQIEQFFPPVVLQ